MEKTMSKKLSEIKQGSVLFTPPLLARPIRLAPLCFLIFFSFTNAYAGIGEDLEKFFKDSGIVDANTTSPGAHRDQSAGYYSGGGMTARMRVKNAQLGTLQLPSINAGCGGIDMYLGGISYISKDGIVQALRHIGGNAAGYAFKLALKTMAPMIDGVMEDLNALANMINQSNINSCETAATLLGGVWPKSDLTSRHLCTAMGSGTGMLTDWATARQGCGAEGKRPEVMSRKDGKTEYKDMLAEEFNVAWEVIKKNGFLMSGKDLAQLCMTLTGTIVSYREGGNGVIARYNSKADRADMIKALKHGGNTPIYKCDNFDRCLKIREENANIPAKNALYVKVATMLDSLSKKAESDVTFTEAEKAFIENVQLPIYKMLNIRSALKHSSVSLTEFTDIIANDLLYQYILEILDLMVEQTASLRNVQVSDEQITAFLDQVHKAKSAVTSKKNEAYREMNQKLLMIQSIMIDEQKVENLFNASQSGAT
jgi:conjugative transfer pilus assembly protein TraH